MVVVPFTLITWLNTWPCDWFQDELQTEKVSLQEQLDASEQDLRHQLNESRGLSTNLQANLSAVQSELQDLSINLEKEKAERVTILLKNAELSQNEESLRQELKQERDELEEALEKIKALQRAVYVHEKNEKSLMLEIEGLNLKMHEKENLEKELCLATEDAIEKNKVIRKSDLVNYQ